MKFAYLFFTVLVIATVPKSMGKVFSRCELAVELVRLGLSREKINDWVCLVENESARNTSIVGGPNENGSYDYGLFQINDKYWCKLEVAGGDCNIKCEDLIDDDITDDVQCAKKIYNRQKFNAWHGWTKRCENKPIPDVNYCFN